MTDAKPDGPWVSRSALHATFVGAIGLAALGFVVGLTVGRRSVGTASARATSGYVEQAADRDLVELLAEVERGQGTRASKQVVYPEVLEKRDVPTPPGQAPASVGAEADVPASPDGVVPRADAPVQSGATVRVLTTADREEATHVRDRLREATLDARMTLARIDGEATYEVFVGAYDAPEQAEGTVRAVRAVLGQAASAVEIVAPEG